MLGLWCYQFRWRDKEMPRERESEREREKQIHCLVLAMKNGITKHFYSARDYPFAQRRIRRREREAKKSFVANKISKAFLSTLFCFGNFGIILTRFWGLLCICYKPQSSRSYPFYKFNDVKEQPKMAGKWGESRKKAESVLVRFASLTLGKLPIEYACGRPTKWQFLGLFFALYSHALLW